MTDEGLEDSSAPSSPSGKLEFANYCWYVEGEETSSAPEQDSAPKEAKARNVFKIYLNAQDAARFSQQHRLIRSNRRLHLIQSKYLTTCKNKAHFKFQNQGATKLLKFRACIVKRLDGRVCLYFRDYFGRTSITKLKKFLGLKESESGIVHFSKITVTYAGDRYNVQFVLGTDGPCANARGDILDTSIQTLMDELGLSVKEQRELKRASEKHELPKNDRIPALDVNVSLIRQILAQVTLPEVLYKKFPNVADKDLLCEVAPEDSATYVRIQQLLRLLEYKRAAKHGL